MERSPSIDDKPTNAIYETRALPPPPYEIVRHVLGTRTIVYAKIFAQPIDPKIIGGTIRQAQQSVEQIMEIHGDGWLPRDLDPYIADEYLGCHIFAESNKLPGPGGVRQHLTWGILNSTLQGLFQIAYIQGYSQEMNWRVVDGRWGQVGNGYIKAGGAQFGLDAVGGKVNQTDIPDS